MSFNGTESEYIGLADAKSFTKRYRDENLGERKAHFFGKDKLSVLLGQPGCKGLRIYYGVNDDEEKVLIVVAADQYENDQVDSTLNQKLLEMAIPCPTACSLVGGL